MAPDGGITAGLTGPMASGIVAGSSEPEATEGGGNTGFCPGIAVEAG
jgi:hypothetical protein